MATTLTRRRFLQYGAAGGAALFLPSPRLHAATTVAGRLTKYVQPVPLPGVGPARRRALLRHFGSAERFLAASQEELGGVPGIPERTARSIYAQLHKAGRA